MSNRNMAASVLVVIAGVGMLRAGDWPQWRGPNRNGIAPESPALAESWPKAGPPRIWQSEPLAGGGGAGFGSPVVAGGKVFVYSSAELRVPIETRTFADRKLREMGWFPEKPSQELLDKIEQARTAEERSTLKGKELNEWMKKWIETNLDEQQRKQFNSFASDRLKRGKDAPDLAVLDKLAEIKDVKFENNELFEKRLTDLNLSDAVRKEVIRRVPTTEDRGQDIIACLSAADGKTLWKKEYPGKLRGNGASSTPCVSAGRVYVAGAASAVYCLDSEKGDEIWKGESGKGDKILMNDSIVSCSPIVIDGLVLVPGGPLTAFDAGTGEVKWTQPKIGHTHCSPVAWENGGRKYVLCNTAGNMFCVNAGDGSIAWEVPGGGSSTVAVQGDTMLVFSGDKKVGLSAYRLSPEKAEKTWTIDNITDRGASPLIYDGCAVAVGSFGVLAAKLDTGEVIWRIKPGTGEISSPVFADGKIFAHAGGSKVVMLKPGETNCSAAATAEMGMLGCSSPAFFDGKLVLRGNGAVHCFDLADKAASEKEAQKP